MKALVIDNEVRGIEERDINLLEYYHEDIAKLFIDCPTNISVGDYYIDGKFVKPDKEVIE